MTDDVHHIPMPEFANSLVGFLLSLKSLFKIAPIIELQWQWESDICLVRELSSLPQN